MSRIFIFLNWYLISVDVLAIFSMFSFLRLRTSKRLNPNYFLPFLIVVFTAFYENLGAYFWYNTELNASVNEFLGNTANPKYTVWFYNIVNQELMTILILLLLRSFLPRNKKKVVNWLLLFFVVSSVLIQILGLEPIYGSQPLIFSIAAGAILTGCGLYFMSFMTDDRYMESNPLRLASFWQVTFILFYHSVIFLKTVSQKYLWSENYAFGNSLEFINTVIWILILGAMLLTYASRFSTLNLDKEPSYV